MKRLSFPLEPGTVLLGKYRIERLLGKGGMAAVYLAHHEMLQQDVAIRILLPDIAEKAENAARFLNEARAAVRLRNEHVAAVMDVGVLEESTAYIVLEYLEGSDLEQVLEASGPLAWPDVVDYVLQALEAVAQAHALGIVHRDIKPSNLFLAKRPNGTPILKVLDFGISKITTSTAEAAVTSTKTMLGSPVFMSPEQLRSAKKVDLRTDIWAVGVVFYHLLTGGYPYEAESIGELFAAVLEQTPASILALRPDVPAELEAVYRRCLSRNVDERYPNVAELARALEPIASADGKHSVMRICKTLASEAPATQTTSQVPSEPPKTATAKPAPGTSTAASSAWSESLAATKKSALPRAAMIGGAVVLCAIGVAFAVVHKSPAASAAASAPVTSSAPPPAETTAAAPVETSPVASAPVQPEPQTAETTAQPAPKPLAGSGAAAKPQTSVASDAHHAAAPHASQRQPGAPPPKPSATSSDVLLMQRN